MHKIITDGKCKTLFLIFIAKAFVIRVDNEPFYKNRPAAALSLS